MLTVIVACACRCFYDITSSNMLRRTFILLAALALILGQDIQAPLLVSTTSCRSWPATALPPPTQALSRASTTTPALVSSCVLATRPARVSLRAEAGVFAHVYDAWGTCNQYIEFNFNQDWSDYRFGMAYYDDPGQGCNGVPTATMSVSRGVQARDIVGRAGQGADDRSAG